MKGPILICTAIMLNDHSNPYIENTTVLSDFPILQSTGQPCTMHVPPGVCTLVPFIVNSFFVHFLV